MIVRSNHMLDIETMTRCRKYPPISSQYISTICLFLLISYKKHLSKSSRIFYLLRCSSEAHKEKTTEFFVQVGHSTTELSYLE